MSNTMLEYYGLQQVVTRAWEGPTTCTDLRIILTTVKAMTAMTLQTSLWHELNFLLAVARRREDRF